MYEPPLSLLLSLLSLRRYTTAFRGSASTPESPHARRKRSGPNAAAAAAAMAAMGMPKLRAATPIGTFRNTTEHLQEEIRRRRNTPIAVARRVIERLFSAVDDAAEPEQGEDACATAAPADLDNDFQGEICRFLGIKPGRGALHAYLANDPGTLEDIPAARRAQVEHIMSTPPPPRRVESTHLSSLRRIIF